jgi:hypothetical protein
MGKHTLPPLRRRGINIGRVIWGKKHETGDEKKSENLIEK